MSIYKYSIKRTEINWVNLYRKIKKTYANRKVDENKNT